jgi:hypothetical protein
VTQNQVVETSCWFESGQGHDPLSPIFGFAKNELQRDWERPSALSRATLDIKDVHCFQL